MKRVAYCVLRVYGSSAFHATRTTQYAMGGHPISFCVSNFIALGSGHLSYES